ncbi:MAG: hypothetical protein LQ347_000579 [Umbilicaria vellea]|nr:MAG: hypothetical protein LQ347_000579 [Umbilicaria vellea]
MATSQSAEAEKIEQKLPRRQKWSVFGRWLGREEQSPCPDLKANSDGPKPSLGRRLSRKVVSGLPRPATSWTQNSERREPLTPVEPSVDERRTVSVDRRMTMSTRPVVLPTASLSTLSVLEGRTPDKGLSFDRPIKRCEDNDSSLEQDPRRDPPPPSPPPPPPEAAPHEDRASEASVEDQTADQIALELEEKWILNLSMHFRDRSPREKFFVTYAEQPNRWRRVTISCDYRDAPTDSLENDLQNLDSQRGKSERIYESIRMSLPNIQFYDTVTNLKLETKDDRLHVHVTEDLNEIIPYPPTNAVKHLSCAMHSESELEFVSHLSGFVYKVNVNGLVCIKKEIPGPDSVDEFLYEINALHALINSTSVIQFQGLIVDEDRAVVKGLLISFAEHGALVDLLYEMKDRLDWAMRESWAKQIVHGLAEIHEAGFVQGDFTLSNIVVNERDEAKIIDINRRGCPVGWEPPEITKLIESSQRISMYIGVKSDLFQLGMVLWALAEGDDEPERQLRPLRKLTLEKGIPQYYCDVVAICLSDRPANRLAAKEMLLLFPPLEDSAVRLSDIREAHPYDDFHGIGLERLPCPPHSDDLPRGLSRGDRSHPDRPGTINIPFDGPGSYMVTRPERGRQPPLSRASPSPTPSAGEEPPLIPASPTAEHTWAQVEIGGSPCLIQKSWAESRDRSPAGGPRDDAERGFRHADSGLADMDIDLDIAGVGGHESLVDYSFSARERLGLDTDDQDPDPTGA